MKRRRPVVHALAFVLALLGLVGCRGKLVTTAELHGAGTAEVDLPPTPGKLSLWADTDGKWEGGENSKMEILYEIDVTKNGASLGHLSCNSSQGGTSVCGTHTTFGSSHSADCELSLDCVFPPAAASGAHLKVAGRPGRNVKEVRKMSLNVRAK